MGKVQDKTALRTRGDFCARTWFKSESRQIHLQGSTMTYLSPFSIFTRRHPLQHAEASVEVGDVVETHRVADIRDLFVCGTEQLTRMSYSYAVQILAEAAARCLREIVRKQAIAHADEIGH